jgi:hypothetical protein
LAEGVVGPAVEAHEHHVRARPVVPSDRQASVDAAELEAIQCADRLEQHRNGHREDSDDSEQGETSAALTGSHARELSGRCEEA